jgi:acetylornithine aminotransferase/acetylornithine/N-succinyldiaminopimelate aminotransferase
MLLPVYTRPAITIDHGEGCYLCDTKGKRYLDFVTGAGVNALGHNHPRVTQTIGAQAGRCLHTSNHYHHAYQQPLADRLLRWTGLSHAFFSNSGSEAIETALKAARARGRHNIVALENSFHGRTMGALSVTGQPKYREPFGPLLPGVTFVRANAIDELREAVDERTAAILVEPVQGEGGVHVLKEGFLREVQRLAHTFGALFIADEIQCGLGRTGVYFAYQHHAGLAPDIVVTAKALAAGLPLAATLFNDRAAAAMGPGLHGSTFGGGPLACRVALEVLDVIEELLPHLRETGAYLHQRLREMSGESRGLGLMAALQLAGEGTPVVEDALSRGLMINCTQRTVIRLLPPYIATRAQIDEAMETLGQSMQQAIDSW